MGKVLDFIDNLGFALFSIQEAKVMLQCNNECFWLKNLEKFFCNYFRSLLDEGYSYKLSTEPKKESSKELRIML